ncbi:TetR/AcrR family transcriptional regulator [Halosolutus gelatinilyticus]|uniref:TetR/AcrR family transcriptional regulator n=1 Tax=Halosolutus gelatinilyticus TaxID=2931975 RepID=UPI001FF1A51E|nr:TetR/AcrR family transcriptional regulator [Halosolutus gelatinilyticus]
MTDPDVREAIMVGTYEALCDRGYTDLTAQDIADRTDKSKSLLFYHYDSKEDLVADFIGYLVERFDERVGALDDRPPVERLAAFVDWFLYGPRDDDRRSFHTALLELRAQAPYNERYRDQLRKSDDRLRTALEGILRDGIESGEFREHDPEETAALLIAAFDGARIRQLTLGCDAYLDRVRSGAVRTVLDDVLADGVEFPTDRRPATAPTDDPDGLRITLGRTANGGDADGSGRGTDGAGEEAADAEATDERADGTDAA